MTSTDFTEFLKRYHDAASQWMAGNPRPWGALCSHTNDVTTFEAWGGVEKGWGPVGLLYDSQSSRNRGGDISFDSQGRFLTPELAVTVDVVRGHLEVDGAAQHVPFELRVTAVFSVEDGRWKLVHRHADPLVKPQF